MQFRVSKSVERLTKSQITNDIECQAIEKKTDIKTLRVGFWDALEKESDVALDNGLLLCDGLVRKGVREMAAIVY